MQLVSMARRHPRWPCGETPTEPATREPDAVRGRKAYNANHSYSSLQAVRLHELTKNVPATVEQVEDAHTADRIAQRLRDLGFVAGEAVRVVAQAPMGGDPLLVQIGSTRFALRRKEAERVTIRLEPAR